jgi:hypothetical protein
MEGKDLDSHVRPRWWRWRRRRHRGEEEDATPDLLFKHPDATLATYILRLMKHLKYASETLAKTQKNT